MDDVTLVDTAPTLPDPNGGSPMAVTINPELRSFIPPLTPEEYGQLEANLVVEGCREPLVVWQETQTLLDGHHRYDICTRHGLPYATTTVSLPSLDAAKAWMIANQLGRRNLTPEQTSYFRGEQYNLLKRQGKRTDLTSHQSEGKSSNTAPTLAACYRVGTATIERDGAYARAVDTLADALGPEVRQTILARESHLTQQQVKQLAAIATQANPQTAHHLLMQAQQAPTPRAARQIVQAAVRRDTPPGELAQGEALALQGVPSAAQCADCGRPLLAPDSVRRGVGPVCRCKTPAAAPGSPSAAPRPPSDSADEQAPMLPAPQSPEGFRMQQAIAEGLAMLYRLAAMYGIEVVEREVMAPLLAKYGRPPLVSEAAPAAEPAPVEVPAPEAPVISIPVIPRGQLPAKVLAALQAHGQQGATASALATELKAPRKQVWASLERLVTQDTATKQGITYIARGEG